MKSVFVSEIVLVYRISLNFVKVFPSIKVNSHIWNYNCDTSARNTVNIMHS